MPEQLQVAPRRLRRHHPFARAVIEVSFIIFLFYSNLLMGEFDRGSRRGKTLAFALHDIFTRENFTIAILAALIGYIVFEFLRARSSQN